MERTKVAPRPGPRACPLCRDEVLEGAAEAWTCGACGAAYHRACVEELGGCGTLGCADRPAGGPRRSARAERPASPDPAALAREQRVAQGRLELHAAKVLAPLAALLLGVVYATGAGGPLAAVAGVLLGLAALALLWHGARGLAHGAGRVGRVGRGILLALTVPVWLAITGAFVGYPLAALLEVIDDRAAASGHLVGVGLFFSFLAFAPVWDAWWVGRE